MIMEDSHVNVYTHVCSLTQLVRTIDLATDKRMTKIMLLENIVVS